MGGTATFDRLELQERLLELRAAIEAGERGRALVVVALMDELVGRTSEP